MNDTALVNSLIKQFESIVSLYNEVEKTTDSYGTEIMLHPSEIHMIAAIGDHENSNLTKLSGYLNITKGATTKMVQNLVKKGLVIKKFAPDSENERVLSLTAIGQRAYSSHQHYRKHLNQQFADIYATVPNDVLVQIEKLGSETEQLFKSIIVERSR
ncbi:MarR family winged helix-turn-helix transcriptional regulator [Sporolactobacillus pectinivorans]|uniref:MarR family winged helix-turn-helix transcriptional regulator n=1 Tax=Sporolactobacillus pectinivorans TaxID=1591408 RepID=UPI000C261162|nr:MarR family winged helix-turn-helix transcriptional regulator [Sporolactobacillus pectinivorans]